MKYTAVIFLIHCLYGFTFSYLKIQIKRYHPIAGIFHLFVLILLWFTDYIVSEKFKLTGFEEIESEAEIKKHLENIINEGSDRFETRHRTKEGDVLDIFVNSRSIWLHGKILVQSIWRDITEIKRFEKVLKTTNAELQEAYKKLGGAYTRMREWKDRLGK